MLVYLASVAALGENRIEESNIPRIVNKCNKTRGKLLGRKSTF